MMLMIDPTNGTHNGWTVVRDWTDAKLEMMTGAVTYVALPYSLGVCAVCKREHKDAVISAIASKKKQPPEPVACEHGGTAIDFMDWADKADLYPPDFHVTVGSTAQIGKVWEVHNERMERKKSAGMAAE